VPFETKDSTTLGGNAGKDLNYKRFIQKDNKNNHKWKEKRESLRDSLKEEGGLGRGLKILTRGLAKNQERIPSKW